MPGIIYGTDNFRCLDHLPTTDGRRLKRRMLMRSGQLHQLDRADWKVLDQLGLATVCDLRSANERRAFPNQLPGHVRQVSLQITSDQRVDGSIYNILAQNPTLEGAEAMMAEVYRMLPTLLAPHMSDLFSVLASTEIPVLIHCTAGKDRTGFAVAVILHALDITEDAIFRDYQLSAQPLAQMPKAKRAKTIENIRRRAGGSCREDAVNVVMDARPEYLDVAYKTINKQYGSMDNYIRTHSGQTNEKLQALRDECLELLAH